MTNKLSIMGIFAHPDDETFGPGATLAKYAHLGHEVSTITATRGQAGQTANLKISNTIGEQREIELRKACQILGVKNTFVLDFFDGTLNEHQLPVLKKMIEEKINLIKPDIIIVLELSGISHHLDHIAVTKAVLQLFDEGRVKPEKIYYFGLPEKVRTIMGLDGGMTGNLVQIDVKKYLPIKIQAMKAHETQQKDWKRILSRTKKIKRQYLEFFGYEYFKVARNAPNIKLSPTQL